MTTENILNQASRVTDFVEELNKIEGLNLKKTKDGKYYKGTCPFCNNGKFTVIAEKKIFYCFGCFKGGDSLVFFANMWNDTMVNAAQRLLDIADKNGTNR